MVSTIEHLTDQQTDMRSYIQRRLVDWVETVSYSPIVENADGQTIRSEKRRIMNGKLHFYFNDSMHFEMLGGRVIVYLAE